MKQAVIHNVGVDISVYDVFTAMNFDNLQLNPEDPNMECASGTQLSNSGLFCEDVNECLDLSICGVGTCENAFGTYICSCPLAHNLQKKLSTDQIYYVFC